MTLPLAQCRLPALGADGSGRYGSRLLRRLGATVTDGDPEPCLRHQPPATAVRSAMRGAGRACELLAGRMARHLSVDGPTLLDRGLHPTRPVGRGVSTGGSARILAGRDGLLAVNLPRPSDWDLLPAWLGGQGPPPADWPAIADAVGNRSTQPLAAAAGELGLAVTPCPAPGVAPDDEQIRHRHRQGTMAPWVLAAGAPVGPRRRELRVVDLSALWAGPLLGALLARAGAAVTKVEDPRRGDLSRARPSAFTRRLNRSKQLVPASFERGSSDRLAALVAGADIVIEASRPRALDELGLGPRHGLRPSQIWVSITAHGRTGPWRDRPGYGDDTAAGGGLYRTVDRRAGFVGDAVADPLTGLHGAVAVLAALVGGWSGHIDLALRDSAATVVAEAAEPATLGATRP